MKRNNDLILKILSMIEDAKPSMSATSLSAGQFLDSFPGLSNEELNDHIQLLAESALIQAEPHQFGWFIIGLTWEGHDFLANSKQPDIWQRAKQVAGHLSFNVFVATLKEVAMQTVKKLLGS